LSTSGTDEVNSRKFKTRRDIALKGPAGREESVTPPLQARRLLWTRIDPMAMLFWSAVINGVVAVPMMIVVMLVVCNGGGR
jgi:hypothetical protein